MKLSIFTLVRHRGNHTIIRNVPGRALRNREHWRRQHPTIQRIMMPFLTTETQMFIIRDWLKIRIMCRRFRKEENTP